MNVFQLLIQMLVEGLLSLLLLRFFQSMLLLDKASYSCQV